jgi:hypothetical protein
MAQPKRPTPELGVNELLSAEITHLLMRADGVERRDVEALVSRVRTPSTPSLLDEERKREDER